MIHDTNLCECVTCERKRVCYSALAGIPDPAAFMSAVRELRTAFEDSDSKTFSAVEKIIDMLPPETADA